MAGSDAGCSQGNRNPVNPPAVSDVKLLKPLTGGEELSLRGKERGKPKEQLRQECRRFLRS